MFVIILFIAVLLLSYANGANDNFKGTATLWGSNTLTYRQSLLLATAFTFAGSLCSYFFAKALVKNFSGAGLVPDALVHSVPFILSVALAAGSTVLLATKLGFPISTTHGLVGALVGAGLMGASHEVNFSRLGNTFFLPLLASPLMAIGLSTVLYRLLTHFRKKAGITAVSCACIGKSQPVELAMPENYTMRVSSASLKVAIADTGQCAIQYQGRFLGMRFQPLVDKLHYFSAGAVCFARSLNDTPKFIALLILCQFFTMKVNFFLLAVVMAIGGLLHARKVATTMSLKITKLNAGQGLTANLVTSLLVIVASRFGLPVSTTHVSVGSIFGIGMVNGSADKKQMKGITASWIMTLPIAAVLGAGFYLLFKTV